MALDRVARIIADYERGALTDASVCLEVYLAAGEGDAGAVFARLPAALQDLVARDVTGADADDARIVESYDGTGQPAADAADLERREETLRRGIAALRHVIVGRVARPGGAGG